MYPYGNTSPYQQSQDQIQNQLRQMLISQPMNNVSEMHTVKVNGRSGAESFNMPPNSDVLLLDMNNPIIWFVQSDGAGYKTITPYDISQHKEVKPEDQYKSLEERITRLEEVIKNGESNSSTFTKPAKPRNFSNDASNRGNDKG